jgi:23S rRNA (adenosine1067-2'-O)-methyltransferase
MPSVYDGYMTENNEPHNPNLIDSLNHPLAQPIRKLLTRSGRQELGKILIDDEENILEAYQAGVKIEAIYFSGENRISENFKNQIPKSIPIHEVATRTSKKLFENDKLSRVFAIAQTPKAIGLEALNSISKDVVVLEDLSISGNIGNITRTSLALGVGGILLLNMDPIDLYDRRLIRASRGYLFSVPMMTANTKDFLEYCKKNNETLLVMDMDAEKTVDEISTLTQRLLIAFGSEKDGCSPEVESAANLKVRIPISNKVESLNVSASAGITLFNRVGFNQKK